MSHGSRLAGLALLLVAGGLAGAPPAHAQQVPTIQLAAGVDEHASTGNFEVLVDKDGRLTVEELAAGAAGPWQRPSQPSPNFGFTSAAYWGRFRLDNPLASDADLVLVFKYALLDQVELFLEEPGGGFSRQVNGDMMPYSARPYDDHHLVFDVSTGAGQSRWVYFRARSYGSMQLGFDVMTPARAGKVGADQLFGHGAYYGMMLALAIYNFFLFLAIRNRAYFWYVLYTVIFVATQMGLDGMAGRLLMREQPWLANMFTPLTVCALLAPPLVFAQHFLDTPRHLPRVHKLVSVAALLALVPVVIAIFGPYAVSIRIGAGVSVGVSLGCAALGIMVLRRGYRPARYYVLAWSAVIVGTIAYVLMSFGVLPANAFFSNLQRIGSMLEIVLLSFALGDQIASLNQEKEAAKAEAVAMDRDLALTGVVQQLFLPKHDSFRSDALSLRGFYAPAARCGGDWWWYEPLPGGGVQVLLGDVTGHGASAAMVTAAVSAAYRALDASVRHGDVPGVLQAVHAGMKEICGGLHQMTIAALEIDPSRGTARLWSAGAPAALILRANGEVDTLAAAGSPLGGGELVIGEAEVRIGPGDRIFVFSDGLPEQAKANGRPLGYGGVSRLLRDTGGKSSEAARASLTTALAELRKAQPQQDDIAFVLVDVQAEHEAQRAA